MEKEIMDKFLENKQNYMDNNSIQHLNVASVDDDVVGGVHSEVVSGVAGEILGVKYDEHNEVHDVGDENERKYVEEVQQSEKQQQQLQTLKNFGLDDDDGIYENNELAEKECSKNAIHEFGNENGGFVFGRDHQILQQQQQHDLFNMGNGHETNGHDININEDFGNLIPTVFEEKLDMMESEIDGFKVEGDFSSTSNVTESVECFVPQVDVKVDTKIEHQEIVDEEEPSSLATNTTNGTSSLSENVPPQVIIAPQADAYNYFVEKLEDKENSDPLAPQRPNELDLEQAPSQLNPDAKEFIPSFSSNPASPTSPFATGIPQTEPVLSDIVETEMYFGQAPSSVPGHVLDDEDMVARSPCKGRGDSKFDAVPLPTELSEFEKEADKRPHELETEDIDGFYQRDEVMTPDQAIQQLPLDDLVEEDKENQYVAYSDGFQSSNYMDHGPETCVDLEADSDMQSSVPQTEDDVMKRSMYVSSNGAIEDVLNSIQPIPTDIESLNDSMIDESGADSTTNHVAGDKELLQIEEKEHVSHSPSTEEIQNNLQNPFSSSNKDLSYLPDSMESRNNMQESMYLGQEQQVQQDEEQNKQTQAEEQALQNQNQAPLSENLFENKEMLQNQPPQMEEHHFQGEDLFCDQLAFRNNKQLGSEHQHLDEQEQCRDDIEKFHVDAKYETQSEEHCALEQNLENQNEEKQLPEDVLQDQANIQDSITGAPTEVGEESLLAFKTNVLIANNGSLENIINNQEQKLDIDESFSPFEITDKVSTTSAFDSLNTPAPAEPQEPNQNDVMTTSLSAREHLLEESKEQQLFSISGLEQQMSGLMLNNNDGDLSQTEEVAATTATTAIEDIAENLTVPNEVIAQGEQYQPQYEVEETQEQSFVDDSFIKHEEECSKEYEQEMDVEPNQPTKSKLESVHESIETPVPDVELKKEPILIEEPSIEKKIDTKLDQENESKPALVYEESTEAPVSNLCHVELENKPAIIEGPIIEAKQAAERFTGEEQTKSANVTEKTTETVAPEILESPMIPQDVAEAKTSEQMKTEQIMEEMKAETIKESQVEELKSNEDKIIKKYEAATPEITTDVPVEAAIASAAVAVAATAAVAAKAAASPTKNQSETAKKSSKTGSSVAAKPKVGATPASKKPIEAAKKPASLAAKPRTVPAKPAVTAADKKPIGKTTTTTTTATAARKSLTATTTTASKVVAKSTTSTTTTRTVTAVASKTTTTSKPTATPRTVSSSTTATRKPATTNGPLAKPRPATAPAKPTTLGLATTNGAAKTKTTPPRAALTSQVRKPTPATSAAKSPVKPTTTNGVNKPASSTLTSRTKTTTSTASVTAGTTSKTFTARPAPKFTSSSSATTTTAKRLTVTGSTTASTANAITKTSSPLRKSAPNKSPTGKTPTKSSTPNAGGLKSKTPITKPSSPSGKPAPIRKPVDTSVAITNGASIPDKKLNGTVENTTTTPTENGDLKAVQIDEQHGDSAVPTIQTQKQQQDPFEKCVDLI